MKTINVVAAIIKKDNKILIAKRGYGEFKGMYEFPGGKIEEMKTHIEVDRFFYHVHYEYPNFILEMDCFLCHLLDEHITLLEHMDYQWIDPNKDIDVIWVPADIQIIDEIRTKGI